MSDQSPGLSEAVMRAMAAAADGADLALDDLQRMASGEWDPTDDEADALATKMLVVLESGIKAAQAERDDALRRVGDARVKLAAVEALLEAALKEANDTDPETP